MTPWASAFTFGALFLVLPAAVLAAALYWLGRRIDGPSGGFLSTPTFSALCLAAGAAVAAFVFELLSRLTSSDWVLWLTSPIVLVLLLIAARGLPDQPATGALLGALSATVGVGLYFVATTMLQQQNDGTALWGVGILYAWVVCGVPLLVAAALIAWSRAGAHQ